MSVSFQPLSPAGGAAVEGLPASVNPGDESAEALRRALYRYGLLLVRGVELDAEAHLSLGRALGALEGHPFPEMCLPGYPEIVELSWQGNPEDEQSDEPVGAIPWHSDLTYLPKPSCGALLKAIEVPPKGGTTGWINIANVYDALPEQTQQKIEGKWVIHDIGAARYLTQDKSASYGGGGKKVRPQAEYPPPVKQPLVWQHPETGRRLLNISPLLTVSFVDEDDEEHRQLLEELKTFATQDRFAYFHQWQPGDLMIWDNWQTMHSVTPFQARYNRRMQRVTLAGRYTTGVYL